MSKFHDFDAMWAEAMPEQAQHPKVRIFGEEIILPAGMPARVMLWAMRSAEAGDDEERALSSAELLKITYAFYGQERVEGWLDKGMTLDQLGDVFRHTLALYNREEDNDSDEGNGTAPRTGAKARSSTTGA